MVQYTPVSGIYVIHNIRTDKIYLGQTNNLKRRWREHKSSLANNHHTNRHLQFAWNKYGAKSFKFRVLEYCSVGKLDEREQHYLSIYAKRGVCYNTALDVIAPLKGLNVSAETRQKKSRALMGHVISPETRAKISNALKGKTKGRKHSPDFVERRVSHSRRDWILISPDGIEYRVHGLTEFCRNHDLIPSGVSNAARGKAKTHKGWICKKV